MTNKQEIDELRAEVRALKRQLSGADMPTEAEVAAYRDWVHQAREARATRAAALGFSKADLAAMRAACPDAQAIVRDHRGAPTSPSQAGASGQVTKSSSNVGLPGSNTGWARTIPLTNGLGQGRRTENAAFVPEKENEHGQES